MPQAWSTLVVQRAGSQSPTQTPVGPRVKRLRPEDIAWCLPLWLGRGSLVVQGGDVGARLGGRGVALRPLQTWNGEGASGEDMRQGPEGEPPKPGPERSVLGPGSSKSQAGQGGDPAGGQAAVT